MKYINAMKFIKIALSKMKQTKIADKESRFTNN